MGESGSTAGSDQFNDREVFVDLLQSTEMFVGGSGSEELAAVNVSEGYESPNLFDA